MSKEERIMILAARLNRLNQNPDNWKSPGVMNKIKREIRNLQK